MTASALDVPVPSHPAKFSAPIVAEIRRVLATYAPTSPLFPVTVLDPFAGLGGVHELADDGYATTGIEIEADWARAHSRTICADSTRMPIADASFDVVCTSPCYGNRMADSAVVFLAADPARRLYAMQALRQVV